MTSNVLIWYPFDNGNSVGKLGSENGIIIRDEEHSDGRHLKLSRAISVRAAEK